MAKEVRKACAYICSANTRRRCDNKISFIKAKSSLTGLIKSHEVSGSQSLTKSHGLMRLSISHSSSATGMSQTAEISVRYILINGQICQVAPPVPLSLPHRR